MKQKFEISAINNNQTFNDWLFRIKKLANARFKWNNIPDTWNKGFLENILYYHGMAGVTYSDEFGFIVSRVTPYGDLNIYDLPSRCVCYSHALNDEKNIRVVYSGINDTKHQRGMVLIQNNYDLVPTFPTIQLFAHRLYEIDRTIDVNLNQQKTPMAMKCSSQKQRLSLLNCYQQYDGNEPVIIVDKDLLNSNAIGTIDTGAPFLVDKLQAHKQAVFAEMLTFLGINTVNFEKKERLIESETTANNQLIRLSVDEELSCRELACRQINKYFGMNISVELNGDLELELKNVSNIVDKVESGDLNE